MKIRITPDVAALVASNVIESEAEALAGNVVDVEADAVKFSDVHVDPTLALALAHGDLEVQWYLKPEQYEVVA